MNSSRELILEMEDDVERTVDALVNGIRSRKVPAKVVGDDSGTAVEFDARKGLSKLPLAWRKNLADNEYKTCEAADRVADWGGKAANKLQSAESYEVYIDAERAADYLRTCPAPDAVEGAWPGKPDTFSHSGTPDPFYGQDVD